MSNSSSSINGNSDERESIEKQIKTLKQSK